MDSGFLKSLALSVILTLVLVIVVNVIGDFAVRPKPGYSPVKIAKTQPKPIKSTTPAPAPAPQETAVAAVTSAVDDFSALLASADPAMGKKISRKCKGCHTFDEGARKLVGPNLWDVVGRPRGSQKGYKYSKAMASAGGEWSYGDLNTFLTNPRKFIKGTKMTFKGLSKPIARAELIAYLRSLSNAPKPLP